MAKKRKRSAKQTGSGIGSLLLIILLFASCSSMCDGNSKSSNNSSAITAPKVQPSVSSVSEEAPESSNPLLNLKVAEADYKDPDSGVTLKRAYVKIPHDKWNALSDDEIVEFYETCISETDATHFTIDFEDGTGIYFPSCSRYDAWEDIDGRVFTTELGAPIFPDSITAWFSKFIARSGLPKVTVHSLRHTYASLMIADGTPLVVVSKALGHAQPSTTANIYAHVIASAEAKAMETFDRFDDVVAVKKAE